MGIFFACAESSSYTLHMQIDFQARIFASLAGNPVVIIH